ncbi:hypothetical protein CRV24_002014 [Beauveria bassiana]|nr:hypothetical protein CRV24_002014 [Beauveria bassiana]
MKLSNTFITLSIGLVAAGPLAIRNPQNSGIPFGANGLLGRAGANGSPQALQKPSTELQPPNCGAGKVLLDGECVNQNQSPEPTIEGNKTPATSSEVVDSGFAHSAPVPEGPLNSEGFSKASCDDKGSASPLQTQSSVQAQDGQNACDCSKPFRSLGSGGSCGDGYENTSFFSGAIKDCTQLNCPEEEFNTQCDAKLQDAKPAAVAESPTPTAANEQKTCDCSKPFRSLGSGGSCGDGYENTSFFSGAIKDCTQLNCPEEEFNTQCNAKPQDAKPTAVAESPTPTAANEKKTCDCYKPFQVPAFDGDSCRAGYKNIAFIWVPECVQIGCSAQDYKAQCDAKPQVADESSDDCPPPRIPGCEHIAAANGCQVCPPGCALGGKPIEEAAEADDEPKDGCPLPDCNRFPGCEPIMGANGCKVCPTGC